MHSLRRLLRLHQHRPQRRRRRRQRRQRRQEGAGETEEEEEEEPEEQEEERGKHQRLREIAWVTASWELVLRRQGVRVRPKVRRLPWYNLLLVLALLALLAPLALPALRELILSSLAWRVPLPRQAGGMQQ